MSLLSPLPIVLDSVMASAEPPQKLLYSRKDCAFVLSMSIRAVYYLIANKRLAFRKIGKKILVPHSELVKFSRANHRELTGTKAQERVA